MKKKLPILLLIPLFGLITSCSFFSNNEPSTVDPEDPVDPVDPTDPTDPVDPEDPVDPVDPADPTDPTDPTDPSNPEEPNEKGKTILHCFDWSLNNIKNNLASIKNAGFGTVQLSPMQPQKDPYNGNWRNEWWKLYQPLGFKVATGNENILGNKNDLISLCTEADNYGVDVIVDVVANHLASDSKKLSYSVKNYEPEIYNNNLIHTTGLSIDDDVIWGNMGDLCDLKTEDSRVQQRVLSLLKEYVDCGVDGFRFDAAKHIETEFDSSTYKSDFWKNTLDETKDYYKTKTNKEMFSYGEILGTVGEGRKYSYYTCRMGITDSDQGSDVLKAARGDITKVKDNYDTKEKPSNLVLWAESHDTYSNSWGESKDDVLETIQKGYVMQASRKDASVLYFARPKNNINLGQIGDESYKNNEVKAINTFRDTFQNQKETISTSNGCFVNVRGSSGAVIVRLSGSSSKIEVSGLPNGEYKDLITNNKYTVNGGELSISSSVNYLILINENSEEVVVPSIDFTYQEVYSNSQNINLTVNNADTVTYQINDGSETVLSGSTITLPSSLSNGVVTLKVKATNNNGSVSKTATMIKTDLLLNKELIIANIDTQNSYFLWVWKDSNNGSWKSVTTDNTLIGCDMGDNNRFIIVKFAKGTTNPDWSNKIEQSEDIVFNKRIYIL